MPSASPRRARTRYLCNTGRSPWERRAAVTPGSLPRAALSSGRHCGAPARSIAVEPRELATASAADISLVRYIQPIVLRVVGAVAVERAGRDGSPSRRPGGCPRRTCGRGWRLQVELLVVGHGEPALAAGEVLGRLQAEAGQRAEGADACARPGWRRAPGPRPRSARACASWRWPRWLRCRRACRGCAPAGSPWCAG